MSNRIRGPINIILLGETQSGKSTFAEALKLYADSNYKIQEGLIGNGTFSQTTDVREDTIHTNLPIFGVYNESSKLIAHEKFMVDSGRDDYEDFLNQRRGLKRSQVGSGAQTYDFTIIDTPGLNDTYKEDEGHVAKIFSKLQGSRAINLVVVLVANGPFTPSFVSAIKGYIGLFPELDDVLAFVHTKVDYRFLHPEYVQFSKRHEMKKQTLNDLMGRSTFPHFVIDCDLEMTKPVRSCITLNTIRKILELAYRNVPVSILPSRMINKTPKMTEVDKIVASRSRSILATTEDTLKFKDEDEGNLLNTIYSYETAIAELDTEMRNNQDLLCSYNTDELELLYEERFTDELQIFSVSDVKEFRFPEQGRQEYKIAKLVQWGRFFAPMAVNGGEGTQHWSCVYTKKNTNWSGYYHVKIYVERRNRYILDINRLSEKLMEQQKELESLRQKMDTHKRQFREERLKIQPLIDSHNRQIQLIRFTSATAIKFDIFYKFLVAKAYVGPESVCSKTAEKIYMDLILDQERNKPLPDEPPVNLLSLSQDEVLAAGHDRQHDPPPSLQDLRENTEVPIETPLTSVQTQSSSHSAGTNDKEHDSTAGAGLDEKKFEEPEKNGLSIANTGIDSEAKGNDPPTATVECEDDEPLYTMDFNADSKAHENDSSAANVSLGCEAKKDDSSVTSVNTDNETKGNDSSITNEPFPITNTEVDSKAQENVPSTIYSKVDSTEKDDSPVTNSKAEYTADDPFSATNINTGIKTQESDDSIEDVSADREAKENDLSVINAKTEYTSKENDSPATNDNLESDASNGVSVEFVDTDYYVDKRVGEHYPNYISSTQAQSTKNAPYGPRHNYINHGANLTGNGLEKSQATRDRNHFALCNFPAPVNNISQYPLPGSASVADTIQRPPFASYAQPRSTQGVHNIDVLSTIWKPEDMRVRPNEKRSSSGAPSNSYYHSTRGRPPERGSSLPSVLGPGQHVTQPQQQVTQPAQQVTQLVQQVTQQQGTRRTQRVQQVSQPATPRKSSKSGWFASKTPFLKNRRDQ
ncbi:hypothetical protein BGZ79_004801 [Entomortierella chlamydospora]|nr:hypothetical protein BGZ79_004801 [Entomortierella chlamydospora]